MKACFLARGGAVLLVILGASVASPQQKPKQPPTKTEEPKKKRLATDLSGFELEDPGKTRAENTRLGATRGMIQPKLLAPRRGKFYGGNALFAWSYGGKATHFTVVFTDENGKEVLRSEANGEAYRLPPTAYQFQAGKVYSWSVSSTPPILGAGPAEPAEFLVVSDQERREINKALAAIPKEDEYKTALARAKVFTGHRLWFDAIGAYTEVVGKFPDRAELYEARGTIYAQLETTKPLADADFARAKQLETRPSPKN